MADPTNEKAVPALLGRVIKSINEGNKKLDKIANPKKDAGDKEAEKEQARQAAHQSKTLDGILAAVSSGDKASKAGGEQKKKSGILSGLFGGVGASLGKGIAGFGGAIASLGAGFGVAMGALGKGIAAFMIGISAGVAVAGGVAWILSKGMPAIVTGLKEFEKLNGPKLISAGKGIALMGAAMTVKAVGDVAGGIASVVTLISDGIGALFGKKKGSQQRLIDDLITFQNMPGLEHKKIEKNAKSVAAYGKAMAVLGVGQTAEGIGAITGAIGGGLTKLFGLKPPIEQMKDLAKENFTPVMITNLENAATAMGTYALAMGKMGGATLLKGASQVINLVGTALDSMAISMGGKSAIDATMSDLQKMSDKGGSLNLKNIENVSQAMGTYALAMAKMAVGGLGKAGASFFNMISSAFTGLTTAFGGASALDNSIADMQKMGRVPKKSINLENLKHVSEAMGTYALAMAKMAGAKAGGAASATAGFFSGLFNGIRSLAGEKVDDLGKALKGIARLSNEKITKEQVAQLKINTEAMGLYASTMMQQAKAGGGGALSAVGNFFSGVFTSLSNFLGFEAEKDPLTALKEFASTKKSITKKELTRIKFNAEAIGEYGTALNNMPKPTGGWAALGTLLTNVVKSIAAFIGPKKEDHMKNLKSFASVDNSVTETEVTRIKSNATAIAAYAAAMQVASKSKVSPTFGATIKALFTGVTGWFSGEDPKTKPMYLLEQFSTYKIDSAQIKKNVNAITEFAKIADVKGIDKLARQLNVGSVAGVMQALPLWEATFNGWDETTYKGWKINPWKKKIVTNYPGLASSDFNKGNVQANLDMMAKAVSTMGLSAKETGGYMTAGSPFIAHEGELVMPSNSGLVANSSVTQAILKAGMDRLTGAPSAGEGGGNTIVAPSSVNNTSYVNSGVEIRRELPLVAVG